LKDGELSGEMQEAEELNLIVIHRFFRPDPRPIRDLSLVEGWPQRKKETILPFNRLKGLRGYLLNIPKLR
jgi:hypothetical protein